MSVMTHLTIENKKYLLIPEESYQELQKNAALKHHPEKTFSINEARAHSKKLIRKWAAEKIIIKQSVAESIAEVSWYLI
jgi:endo-beta-N-acetylglucosaminidase D